MRPLALLLVLLALLPSALANYAAEGGTPGHLPVASNPQVLCVFVLDEGGSDECRNTEPGNGLRQLRVRIVGSANVFAVADRLIDPVNNGWDQLALVQCNGSTKACVGTLSGVVTAPPYSGTFHLLVQVSSAAPRTTVVVSLESGTLSPF